MNAKQRRVARRAKARTTPWPQIRITCTGADEVDAALKRIAESMLLPAAGIAAAGVTFAQATESLNAFARAWVSAEPRHLLFRSWLDQRQALDPDLTATLLDLARSGQEADFRWLAASAGVRAEELDALWAGTVARTR